MSRDFEDSNYLDYSDYPDISLSPYSSKDLYINYRFVKTTLNSYLIRLRRLSSLLFA